MSKAPSMPFFVDAYLADTTHLSTEEHGAYLLLLMAMWRRGGSVPDDDSDNARMVGLPLRRWREMKARLGRFLIFQDGEIRQKRLQKEWDFVAKRIAVRRANGALGGRPPLNGIKHLPKANGSAQDIENESTHTHTQLSKGDATHLSEAKAPDAGKKSRRREAYPEAFEALWAAFPTDRLMSKKAAFLVWKRMDTDSQALAATSVASFKAYCREHPDYRPVHLVRYLSQERYVGFAETAAKVAGQVFVAKGTAAWDAWQAVKKTPAMKATTGDFGWWFPSERPMQ